MLFQREGIPRGVLAVIPAPLKVGEQMKQPEEFWGADLAERIFLLHTSSWLRSRKQYGACFVPPGPGSSTNSNMYTHLAESTV